MLKSLKLQPRVPGLLPRHRDALPGFVPVNKDYQRLDYYIKTPPTFISLVHASTATSVDPTIPSRAGN